ncbi:MAG: efflux RND transporter periplasmic adaptor subunit [Betaproteobacteria bacterium]|nr:efflux RND transporter periplasmic adaptor subunit [Betaproteobacteria bacterium]
MKTPPSSIGIVLRCLAPLARSARAVLCFLTVGGLLGLTACSPSESGKTAPPGNAPQAAAPAPPPPQVGVVAVALADVGLIEELPGRIEPLRIAQVRARAAGIVQQRLFREGADVKAGQVLFRIDPAPYEAALASAQATLARAQANLSQASALAERYRPLVAANAVSKQDFANAVAAQKQAEAEVLAGQAAVQTASINLGHTTVTAPISGRIGRALVTEGALVGQGEATPLAVIQQIEPVFVNFTQSANEALRLRRDFEQGRLQRATGSDAVLVRVLLDGGSIHPQAGRLLFSDLTVDATSGQVTLRAEVPNPGGVLLPGLYVRVRLEQAKAANAMLLPQQAVMRSNQGDTVMLVGADGKITVRPVKVGGSNQGQWLILDGLRNGEQVIVDGFQKIRPNQPVRPVPWSPPGAGATATAPRS